MRHRKRLVALFGSVAIAASAGMAVIGSGVANAAACSPPTTTTDNVAGSLRNVLETLPDGCDLVELAAGATYDLTSGDDIEIVGPVTIEGNGATIRQTAEDRVLFTDSDLTLRNVTITGGRSGSRGGGLRLDSEAELRVENATFIDNKTSSSSGAIAATGPVLITGSTIANNCSQDDGGALGNVDDDLTIVNSTITGNVASDDGAIDMDEKGDLTLVYTDVVGNIHDDELECGLKELQEALSPDADSIEDAAVEPDDAEAQNTNQPANLELAGSFSSFGSVVARPIDRDNGADALNAFNCEFASEGPNTASSGYNFSDDDTCGFTNTAAGDRENAGDPGLGALASNGGPTQTMLPSATSPLLDFIPVASCGGGDGVAGFAVTTDQRGVTRPQGPGCEIGSVEVEVAVAVAAAPIEVVITFTG